MSDQAAKRLRTAEPEIGPPVLPAEMLELVISKMNVNEHIGCRVVSKFFKQAVERIKLRSVVIAESEESACKSVFSYARIGYREYDWAERVEYPRYSDQFWFVSNDPVYESHSLIAPNTSAGLRMLVNHFDLSQLRRLFIVEVRNGRTHFELLNQLIQLEHLQINWIRPDCDLTLQLPNLRTLSIVRLIGRHDSGAFELLVDFKVTLITPNLKHFETHTLWRSMFRFEHPDSVVFLQVRRCDFEDVLRLRNLEVLVCERAESLIQLDIRLNLLTFPKLKRVDCARMDADEAKRVHEICKRNRINFYFCGCRIDDLDGDLRVYLERAGREDHLPLLKMERMLHNYDRLADSMYICEGIRYWEWFDPYFPEKLPENFAKKFYLVRDIYMGQVKNVNYFVELLSCFKGLKVLKCAPLPQEFFDRHSHLLARLQVLSYTVDCSPNKIDEVNKNDKVNFDFILNLKLLEKFETNLPISMRLVSEAFNSLKYLKSFDLDRDWNYLSKKKQEKLPKFMICRAEHGRDGYTLTDFDSSLKYPKSHFIPKAELIQFVEELFPALSRRDH